MRGANCRPAAEPQSVSVAKNPRLSCWRRLQTQPDEAARPTAQAAPSPAPPPAQSVAPPVEVKTEPYATMRPPAPMTRAGAGRTGAARRLLLARTADGLGVQLSQAQDALARARRSPCHEGFRSVRRRGEGVVLHRLHRRRARLQPEGRSDADPEDVPDARQGAGGDSSAPSPIPDGRIGAICWRRTPR